MGFEEFAGGGAALNRAELPSVEVVALAVLMGVRFGFACVFLGLS